MRILFSMISVLLLLGMMAFAAEEKPRCEQCGMFYDKSPTQITATISIDGKEGEHLFESFGCLINFVKDATADEDSEKFEMVGIEVLDYDTFDADKPVMMNAKEAHFLYGTEPIPGSMGPFIAAFPDVKSALGAMDDLGGEAMEFKEVMKALMKAEGGGCAGCAGGGGCGGGKKSTEDKG